MIHRLRFSATLRFIGSLCLSILVASLLSDVFAMVVRGQSVDVSASQPTMDQVAVLQKIDPECEKYGRCDESLNTAFGAIFISSFQEKLMSPSDFRVSGDVSFTWIPEAYPGWSPENLSFACRLRDCNFPGWTSVSSFRQGPAEVWTANFTTDVKESTSFHLYPFDQHWVHLKLVGKDALSQKFISTLDVPSYHIEISDLVLDGKTSDFVIDFATASGNIEFSNSNFSSAVSGLSARDSRMEGGSFAKDSFAKEKLLAQRNPYDASSFAISLHVKRRIPAALWMVVVPLLLIVLNTNLAFHWRENSPASRFGSSGLLTAVSLFFASRIFRPDVDYLVFTDLWFMIVFIIVTCNNILLIWLFRFYKHRAAQKSMGAQLKPAYKVENKLTLLSVFSTLLIVALLCIAAFLFSQYPRSSTAYLDWSSNYYPTTGASAVRVFEQSSFHSDQGGFLPYSSPD